MAFAIEWDKTGERYFEMGVSRGVLYVQNSNGTYQDGVAWNGLTAVTQSPSGAEPTDLWADDIKYATLRSAETFGGTIEAYTYPPEFEECDGSKEAGVGVFLGQQSRASFGFSYVTKVGSDTDTSGGNDYKIHLVYGASVNPSERSYATINDSPDATTLSWEFTTTPVNVGTVNDVEYKPVAHIVIDTKRVNNKTKITALENILYGNSEASPATSATLPDPATVIGMFPA